MIEKETIRAIKNGIDLKAYIESIGYTFKKAGQSYFCRCPFKSHQDKNPSFSVSVDKQLFRCFGCGKGGDLLTFVMEHDQITFIQAVKKLGTRLKGGRI